MKLLSLNPFGTSIGLLALLLVTSGRAQQAITVPVPMLYNQGDPTSDEQYLLQRLNRARMDPVGEGQRLAAWLRTTTDGQAVVQYYGVDPSQVASAIAALPAVPPLALDPDLLLAARQHATDMATHNYLGHTGSDGSSPEDRVAATGYDGYCREENAALSLTSLDTIHAGYFVDWGVPDLGHRQNSLSGDKCLNAVGIGLTTVPANASLAETEDYGCPPLSITHGILSSLDAPAMLTGVAYHDANGNGQYDPGEGVAGATVTMDGGTYYAVTSASGGYALPLVNADGTNVDGPANVHVALPNSTDLRTTTITVLDYKGPSSSYRANVEWDIVSGGAPVAADAAQLSFSGGGTVARGGKLKLVVARPANSDPTQRVTVAYRLTGTAVAGVDYAALPGTLTIPAGKATARIKVTALASTVLNQQSGAITLVIKLKGVSGAQGKASVTILP